MPWTETTWTEFCSWHRYNQKVDFKSVQGDCGKPAHRTLFLRPGWRPLVTVPIPSPLPVGTVSPMPGHVHPPRCVCLTPAGEFRASGASSGLRRPRWHLQGTQGCTLVFPVEGSPRPHSHAPQPCQPARYQLCPRMAPGGVLRQRSRVLSQRRVRPPRAECPTGVMKWTFL